MNAEWRALAALALCRYIGGEWSTESFKPLWLGGGTKLKGGTGGAPLVPAARGAAPRTRGETGERRGAINPTFGTGARQGPPPTRHTPWRRARRVAAAAPRGRAPPRPDRPAPNKTK